MKIGIDLDNTINSDLKSIEFFSLITNLLKGKAEIFIITYRSPEDRKATREELSLLGIHYNHLVITMDKAAFIMKNKIDVYFDDTDEFFLELPESVLVFKIREFGNFDFEDHKWVYDDKTGKKI